MESAFGERVHRILTLNIMIPSMEPFRNLLRVVDKLLHDNTLTLPCHRYKNVNKRVVAKIATRKNHSTCRCEVSLTGGPTEGRPLRRIERVP